LVVAHASWALYEREVLAALDRVASPEKVSMLPGGSTQGADFLIDTTGELVAVIVKYRSRGLITRRDLESDLAKAANRGYPAVLVVTNSRFRSASEENATAAFLEENGRRHFEIVRWLDGQDDAALRLALSSLTKRIRRAASRSQQERPQAGPESHS